VTDPHARFTGPSQHIDLDGTVTGDPVGTADEPSIIVAGIRHACLADIDDPALRDAAADLLEDFRSVAHLGAPIVQALAILAELVGEPVEMSYSELDELDEMFAVTVGGAFAGTAGGRADGAIVDGLDELPGGASNRA
jgi:hypothetical protein